VKETTLKSAFSAKDALTLNLLRGDAGVDGDSAMLNILLSEQFMQVHGGGTLQDKTSYISSRVPRPGRIEFKKRDAYDTEVLLLGTCFIVRENVDIVEYFPEGSGFKIVGDHSTRIRICNVWHLESDDEWRCVHTAVSARTSARAQ